MVFMWSPALISSPPSPQDIIIHTQTGGQTLALHYLPPDNITTLSAQFSLLEHINYTFIKVLNHQNPHNMCMVYGIKACIESHHTIT